MPDNGVMADIKTSERTHRKRGGVMCDCNEGTLLKEFDNEKSYYWSELAEMTEVCASCGSEQPKQEEVKESEVK